jgi:hypothetical protein
VISPYPARNGIEVPIESFSTALLRDRARHLFLITTASILTRHPKIALCSTGT